MSEMSEDTLLLTNASTESTTTDANNTDLIYRDALWFVNNELDDSTKSPTVYVGMWWNNLRFGPGKLHDITTGEVVYENDDFDDWDNYWESDDKYESYHESLEKGIRYSENGKLVYIQETYGRTSYFDDEEKLIRIEFMKGHWNHGCVNFFAGSVDKLVRIEYSNEHRFSDGTSGYGMVNYYDGFDKLTTTMFTDKHPRHGEILYYDGNKLTRIEYSKSHKEYDRTCYYDYHGDFYIEHGENHMTRGEIHYFRRPNFLFRIEYTKSHNFHGEIRYFSGSHDKLICIKFQKDHPNHGQIRYYHGVREQLGKLQAGNMEYFRCEYSEEHDFHGDIRFYRFSGDKFTLVHREFSKDHKNHGEICYSLDDGYRHRVEFSEEHKLHRQIRYFEDNKLVRIEFSKDHRNHGEIHHVDDSFKPNRVEFSENHKLHGNIRYVKGSFGNVIRVEYAKDHEMHGQIEYYENNKLTHIEYTKQHRWSDGRSGYGQIRYCDGDKLFHKEFSKDHEHYGEIQYYENNNLTRIEYSKDQNWHGEIEYYENNKMTRVEFSKGHICHGEIHYYAGDSRKFIRTEFAKNHKNYGEIHYAKRGYDFYGLQLTRIEYSKDHQLHGEIRYYLPSTLTRRGERGKLTRIEYSNDHKHHGEIRSYDGMDKLICFEKSNVSKDHGKQGNIDNLTRKKSKDPKSYCATCNIGSFVQRPDGWNCDNCFYKKDESPNLLPESSRKVPTYYQDGEVPADKKRSEAETAKLIEERKARRNGTNGLDTSPKTSPSKAGKQKVSFADVSVSNPSKQLCNDIVTAEQRKMEKQCPGCGTWSSRTLGNNHISCECGIQFCFLCLTRVKGHKDAATGVQHFPNVCPQHGGDIVKPTAAALHKLGSSAKCLTVSEACFSVETNAIELGTFTNHAKERAEERGVSTLHVQTTKKYGGEVVTTDSKGNPSVMIVHRNQSGKVLGKVYESADGSRVKTVV